MDSYEKFMNEYVAFMKKYQNSGNAASMLADYVLSLIHIFHSFPPEI